MRYLLLAALGGLVCASTACDGSTTGPGGLKLRDGVSVVADFPPVTAECLQTSNCPQYTVPEIVDVVRRGQDWVVLYHARYWIDPGFGRWDVRSGYFVSRDDGKSWQRVELTVTEPYISDRIAMAHGRAFPTEMRC